MSLPPRRAACIPGTPASLCVLVLLLLLLTPRGPLASGESSQRGAHRGSGSAGDAAREGLPRKSSPSSLPYNGVSLCPSWSCRGHSERAALPVFNHHTGDSSQNGQ